MTDVAGNPEEERRADFYYQPWAQEAVCRYFYGKVWLVVECCFLLASVCGLDSEVPNYVLRGEEVEPLHASC